MGAPDGVDVFPIKNGDIPASYVSCWYRAVAPVYFPRKQMPELVGWGGGVGWVGDDDVLCTCTHVTCYATAGVVGWGGLGMMTFFALAHMWHATQLLGWWGGVGWGWWRSLHLHTCDMLRNCWGGGVGSSMIPLIICVFCEFSSPDIFCFSFGHTMDRWNVFSWLWKWKNHQRDSFDSFCVWLRTQ